MKTRVAVVFGGNSVEHEVSVISAIQAIMSMDTEKYEITPVYIAKNGEMYTGANVGNIEAYKNIDKLIHCDRCDVVKEGSKVFLAPYPMKAFGKKNKIEIDVAFPIVHGTNVEDGTLQGYLKTIGIPYVGCDVTSSAIGMDKYIMKTVLKDNDIPVLDGALYTVGDFKNLLFRTVNDHVDVLGSRISILGDLLGNINKISQYSLVTHNVCVFNNVFRVRRRLH